MLGRGIVEVERSRHRHLRRAREDSGQAAPEQRLERLLAIDDIRNLLLEAWNLTRIEFECPMQVDELECVEDDVSRVGESIGFHDVHAPGREDSSDAAKGTRAGA